jgi:hypothetical protein
VRRTSLRERLERHESQRQTEVDGEERLPRHEAHGNHALHIFLQRFV